MQNDAPNPNNLIEEEIASMSRVEQIMARMVKSQHVQTFLEAIYHEIVQDRAHQKLNFKPEFLYEAAAASGFSHGQLMLIQQLCQLGHVLPDSQQ